MARRLTLTFTALIALLVCATAVVYTQAVWQQQALNRLNQHILPMQVATDHLRVGLGDAQRGLRGYLLTGEPRFLDPYHQARRDYPELVSRLREVSEAGERGLVDAAVRAADQWWQTTASGLTIAPRSDAAAAVVARGKERFDAFVAAIDELNNRLRVTVEQLRTRQSRDADTTRAVLLVTLLIVSGAATLVGWRTSRALAEPLREVRDTVLRLAHGDRAARAPVAGPAEVRTVAAVVNELADETERLREVEAERAELREAAYRLGASVRADLDVGRVVGVTTENARVAFDADGVVVHLLHDDALLRGPGSWSGDAAGPGWRPLVCSVGAAWELYADRAVNVRAAQEANGDPWSVIDVPFGTGWRLLGVLTLGRRGDDQPWRPAEVEALQIVAAELAYGIHQARLFANEREVVERLRALDRTKNDFVATVSHELRTPLTNIAGYVEMLRDDVAGPRTAAQDQMLEVVNRNVIRLRVLIEDLLTLSRIEAGGYGATRGPVDVTDLMTAVGREHADVAQAKGVALTVSPPKQRLTVDADREQLRRALGNLVANGVKFTPAGGRVTLGVKHSPRSGDTGLVTFTVSDTGVGIPDAEQARLFDRFFRGEGAMREQVPGTGLGLAIVRAIVDNHGGTLRVRSDEGAGTTVTVVLPAARSAVRPGLEGRARAGA